MSNTIFFNKKGKFSFLFKHIINEYFTARLHQPNFTRYTLLNRAVRIILYFHCGEANVNGIADQVKLIEIEYFVGYCTKAWILSLGGHITTTTQVLQAIHPLLGINTLANIDFKLRSTYRIITVFKSNRQIWIL